MLDRHRPENQQGLRIRLEGSVQGVGMRPWVHSVATGEHLGGRIWNDSDSVTIEAFGQKDRLAHFVDVLRAPPMPAAQIRGLRSEPIPFEPTPRFEIVGSRHEGVHRPSIPPDLALCEDCRREIFDIFDRRYLYAFTNCTRCGPRYTIARDVPYDRERTSMAAFSMCPSCRAEYENVFDRRFHAQPNACRECGPRLDLIDIAGRAIRGDAISEAAKLLRGGQILAIKGLGGYHLACDASSGGVVARLRERKHRYAKPLAIMAPTLEAAERLAVLGPLEREALAGAVRPIVLAPKLAGSPLADEIAPGAALVGLMLPYTPLHALLLDAFRGPLVMTSANASDEPMAFEDRDAFARLGTIADAMLRHDRQIVARCDDSIVRVLGDAPVVLRRARGLVPSATCVSRGFPMPLLACGAQLKNTFCLAAGNEAWIGPHIGDLETDEACRGFEEAVGRFSHFVGIEPEAIAHDLHPGYFSTRWARTKPATARVAVQHHHAHAASALAEHDIEGPVLALAWDGTGDGGDGSAWGGELLAADTAGFLRVATLREVALAGSDTAIREVWRIALALLDDAFDGAPPIENLRLFDGVAAERVALVRRMLQANIHSPRAHGAGRYFDAFGALVLSRSVARFEGEIATALEAVACRDERRSYPFGLESSSRSGRPDDLPLATADLRPAVRALVADLLDGAAAPVLAARVHATMSAVAGEMAALGRRCFGELPLVLTGGCFQNRRLFEDVCAAASPGTRLITHRDVPPNDGGISLGQAVVAAATLRGDVSSLGAAATRARMY